MTTTVEPVLTTVRRQAIARAIARVLTPHQLTMARELASAENPGHGAAQPERVLFWMRLNMPVAAAWVDTLL